MKVLSVVGARPQFVKLAPVAEALAKVGAEHVIVHTGQHYDENMSGSFFRTLRIPEPTVDLGVGSGTHASQTGAMITALGPVLEAHSPNWVLAYGDTNSTLAAAVCATKLHIPLAHLEAGLRSFNRRMPEEHNRVLTDHAADLCLAPTSVAMGHLSTEGLANRAILVGDVMTDVLRRVASEVEATPVESPIPVDGDDFVLATIHRPDNTDDPKTLRSLIDGLAGLERTVFLAAHPRLAASAHRHGIDLRTGSIQPVPPLSYPALVQALSRAKCVVTDSGGLQKEAYLMGVPTVTARSETEWVETLAGNWNVLAPDPSDIRAAVARPKPTAERGAPFGDGDAAVRSIRALMEWSSR